MITVTADFNPPIKVTLRAQACLALRMNEGYCKRKPAESIQAVRSTITLLWWRHTILLALSGLLRMKDDDGGDWGSAEYISTDQSIHINDLIKETKSNLAAFLKFVGAESVEKILASDYQKAIAPLNQKKNARQPEHQLGD